MSSFAKQSLLTLNDCKSIAFTPSYSGNEDWCEPSFGSSAADFCAILYCYESSEE
jgi:hypothetical protein